MQINQLRHEIAVKIVYYGPAYSGKTTNLERLFATTDPSRRGRLTSMKNQTDGALFFDHLQIELNKIGGFTPRFNLYAVPGQVEYEVTRRLILRDADAIVFVMDSSADRMPDNLRSWRQLKNHLASLAPDDRSIPVIVQLNKRDVTSALPVAEIKRILQLDKLPCIEAQAVRDIGTRETLRITITAVLSNRNWYPRPTRSS